MNHEVLDLFVYVNLVYIINIAIFIKDFFGLCLKFVFGKETLR